MEAWIPITIAAALAQTFRFMLQKQLKTTGLSTGGATFARFVYSAPLVAVLIAIYARSSGQVFPTMPDRFWLFAISGGLAQILATMCVVALFTERNFAVGITFKKTEVLQTALIGFAVLGEGITPTAILAITIGFVGVVLLSDPPGGQTDSFWRRVMNRASGLGLLSGFLFGVSAIGYRGAALSLSVDDVIVRAGLTLAIVTTFQTILMALWMSWGERGEIGRVVRNCRSCWLHQPSPTPASF